MRVSEVTALRKGLDSNIVPVELQASELSELDRNMIADRMTPEEEYDEESPLYVTYGQLDEDGNTVPSEPIDSYGDDTNVILVHDDTVEELLNAVREDETALRA